MNLAPLFRVDRLMILVGDLSSLERGSMSRVARIMRIGLWMSCAVAWLDVASVLVGGPSLRPFASTLQAQDDSQRNGQCTTDSPKPHEALMIGAARIEITPQEPVILAGYGHRVGPSEGIDQPLYARAIALGDNEPVIAITVDNCGVPKALADRVKADLEAASVTSAGRVAILSTHTHNAPSLPGYAPVLWAGRATDQEMASAERYADYLVAQLRRVAIDAWESRTAATLSWGQGEVDFGGNRRIMIEGVWSGFGLQPDAPVDHSLPLLVARNSQQQVIALWTTYACHCTTLGGVNRVAGDWAGCAALALEQTHPQAVALVSIGCGADVGPQPGGNADLAQQHGQSIADEVDRLLETELIALQALPSVEAIELQLPFDRVPDREAWEAEQARGGFEATRATRMLARLDAGESLPEHLDYEVTRWSFGDQLAMVFLPGEVTVDYAVRLKQTLDWQRLWIHGWSNDVPCYIPSRRVLLEGGYEADFSMVYYDQPSRFAVEVEEVIVQGVVQLLGDRWQADPQTPAPDWFRYELSQEAMRRRLTNGVEMLRGEAEALRELLEVAPESWQRPLESWSEPPRRSAWIDFLGLTRDRAFLRQDSLENRLLWQSDLVEANEAGIRFAFTGGLGWRSQAATPGFELRVWAPGTQTPQTLRFDVSEKPTRWQSESKSLELIYLPTWGNQEDSAGLFLLLCHTGSDQQGRWRFEVQSLGSQSQRWFALDDSVDGPKVAGLLRQLLQDSASQ